MRAGPAAGARLLRIANALVCAPLACGLLLACGGELDGAGVEPADSPVTQAARAELGRLLFYDPILSADGQTACATCHSEHWGMGDGLPLSIGAGAGDLVGPGRRGAAVGRRNAPTLWNVGARGALFWDGRAGSLEEQAHLPFEIEVELDLPIEDALAAVADVTEYRERFEAAFPGRASAVDVHTLTSALAAFERTLISDHAPYDAYLAGDRGALSARMLEGLSLFEELECGACHTPPLFQSDRYARRLPPRAGSEHSDQLDLGRYEVTGEPADQKAFRVPTLRNVRDTAPYFHDGSVPALREAIELEVSVQVAQGRRQPEGTEIDALTELIAKGLLDLSKNPHRPDRVPSGLPLPRDGFRIVR